MTLGTRDLTRCVGAVVLALTLTACGGDDHTDTGPTPGDTTPGDTTPGDTTPATPSAGRPAQEPAPATSTTPGRDTITAAIGEPIALTGLDGQRLTATVVTVVAPAPPEHADATPAAGSRYVAVRWRITNTGDIVVDDTPDSGSAVIDDKNRRFGPTYQSTGAGPEFPSGVIIPPGQSRLGYVTYSLPHDSAPRLIRFGPDSGFAPQVGQWEVD